MSRKPLIGKNGNKIFLLDTEGLSAIDRETNFDMHILTLALLFSSTFMFNTRGVIDDRTLRDLHFVSTLASKILIAYDDIESEDNIKYYMPNFVFILRDFMLDLIDDEDNEITADKYLENSLTEISCGKYSNITNNVRQKLQKYFPSRRCFTLVRPVDEEEDLQFLENYKEKNIKLRTNFITYFEELRNYILEKSENKSFNNIKLNGLQIVQCMMNYVDAINIPGGIPSIKNAWSNIQKLEAKKVINEIKEGFSNDILNKINLPIA